MANTNSIAWPNMLDVSRNKAAIAEDNASIVNRVRLMLLTEPTELYMNPTYGVGLKKYLFQYNSENLIAIIKDKIIEQLRLWEPSVDADRTIVTPGLLFTGTGEPAASYNRLMLTVILFNKFGEELKIEINEGF